MSLKKLQPRRCKDATLQNTEEHEMEIRIIAVLSTELSAYTHNEIVKESYFFNGYLLTIKIISKTDWKELEKNLKIFKENCGGNLRKVFLEDLKRISMELENCLRRTQK